MKRNDAGGIDASFEMISVADLDSRGTKETARMDAILCAVFVVLGLLLDLYSFLHGDRSYTLLYAVALRVWMLVFCVQFIINVMAQKSMNHEFSLLLNAFLDGGGHGGGMHATIEHFFDVMTELDSILQFQINVNKMAYITCYLIFIQGLLYMNSHPRVAVLTQTLIKACDDIVHFIMLFLLIFLTFAFIGHWSFAPVAPGFETLLVACLTQFQMLVGEFPWDSMRGLAATDFMLLQVYTLLFTLFTFFVLLNFFLAIVVDSFTKVKEEVSAMVVENNVLWDLGDVIILKVAEFYQSVMPKPAQKHLPIFRQRYMFPKTSAVLDWLRQCELADSEFKEGVWDHVCRDDRYDQPLDAVGMAARFELPKIAKEPPKPPAHKPGEPAPPPPPVHAVHRFIALYLSKAQDMAMKKRDMDSLELKKRSVTQQFKERKEKLRAIDAPEEDEEPPSPASPKTLQRKDSSIAKKAQKQLLRDQAMEEQIRNNPEGAVASGGAPRKRKLELQLAERDARVLELRRKIKERQEELEKFEKEAHNLSMACVRAGKAPFPTDKNLAANGAAPDLKI